MMFVLPTPSLEHVAGVKIVAALWNQADILNSIPRKPLLTLYTDTLEWKAVEDRVEANLSALPIPNQIKKQHRRFIKIIGKEMSSWCEYHTSNRYDCQWLSSVFPRQFRWTMRGTVDYKKTAELIIEDQTVDAEKRYIIACLNCLEDDARHLIQRISEGRKWQLVEAARSGESGIQNHLEIFFTREFSGWPDVLRQHLRQELFWTSESIQERLFKESLGCGDRWMWKYLFRKLMPRERENVFSVNFNLYFLFLMSGEQQEEAFRRSSKNILECLLRWPTQSLFLEAAQRGWRFLKAHECTELLFDIVLRIICGEVDADYPRLFLKCWRLNLSNCRRKFLDDTVHLLILLDTEEEEIIKIVLYEAPSRQILSLSDGSRGIGSLRQRMIKNDALYEALKECTADRSTDENSRVRWKYLRRLAEFVAKSRKSL